MTAAVLEHTTGGQVRGLDELDGRRTEGFTLVELVVTVAIIVTLSALAIPMYSGYLEKARVARAIVEIRTIERAVDLYELENGLFPDSLDLVGMSAISDPWGRPYEYLRLAGPVASASGPGPDRREGSEGGTPWDFLFPRAAYAEPSGGGQEPKPRKDRFLVPINSDYDLYSKGLDGKSVAPLTAKASRDDVVRANDGAFVGLAVDF